MKPENVRTGTVVGRFLFGLGDGPDVGNEPDFVAARGRVTFIAGESTQPDPGALPAPVTILLDPVVGVFDSEGYLCTMNADGTAGVRGVKLIANDNPELIVQDWNWNVSYKFEPSTGMTHTIPPHGLYVYADGETDLVTAIKLPTSPGIAIEQVEAAVLRAEAEAAAAAQSVQEMATLATNTLGRTFVEATVVGDDLVLARENGVEIVAGNVRGPEGPAGPNTVPTDQAVAGNVSTAGTLTRDAVVAVVDGRTVDTPQLADQAVTGGKIAPDSVGLDRLTQGMRDQFDQYEQQISDRPTGEVVDQQIGLLAVPRTASKVLGALTFQSAFREWSLPPNPAGAGAGGVAIGHGAAGALPDYVDEGSVKDFIAIGRDALGQATNGNMNIAMGVLAMGKGSGGQANIGIGTFSLMNVSGGTRNIGIGSLTMPFLTTGYQNSMIGRDSGQGLLEGRRNVGFGYRSMGCGHQPIGLSGEIEHQYQSNAEDNAAVGNNALGYVTGYKNVGVGLNAGARFANSWGNTFVGADVAAQFGIDVSENGYALDRTVKTGTYAQAGTTLTVTVTGHGVTAGKKVGLTFSSGLGTSERQWLLPSSIPDADTLVFTSPKSLTASGTVTIDTVETTTTVTLGRQITVVGQGAASASKMIGNNTTIVGADAAPNATGTTNSVFGSRAGGLLTTGYNNTLLGYNAGRVLVDGSNMTDQVNATAIGNNSSVSGSNQVQLGNSATTTYVYGTVQNRSDRRDKADVRDTVLGLDFINQLRPVDYRWDMREDYEDFTPDGSMKRERFHHGLIAQEVAKVIEATGQDFGGFQDHAVSGGSDVLSIGYDELIAPIIKSIQQINNRVLALEGEA